MLIKQMIFYARIVLVIVIILMIITGIWLYYTFKIKKRKRLEDRVIDYDSFEKRDATEYLRFDDIKNNMIITDNLKRFVGIINAKGYDYFQARPNEQNRTEAGYGSFINMITAPMEYRQYTRAIDLDNLKARYKNAYDRVEEELYNTSEDFNDRRATYYDLREKGQLTEKIEWELLTQCEQLASRVNVLEWKRVHLADNIEYAEIMSKGTEPEKVQSYIFDWEYDPFHSVEDLTDSEILKKAEKELSRKADAFIHALSNAGVRASRVRTNDLIYMVRRHFHPVTANIFTGKDIENSNFYEEITSSPAIRESDFELSMEDGSFDELNNARDTVYADMLNRGIEPETARKMTESFSKEQLLGEKLIETKKEMVGTDELDERKNEILTNHFEEREKQRIKAINDSKERSKRTMKSENTQNFSTGLEFTGLEFDMTL